MAISRYLLPVPISGSRPRAPELLVRVSSSSSAVTTPSPPSMSMMIERMCVSSSPTYSSSFVRPRRNHFTFPRALRRARAELNESGGVPSADALTNFKHVLLPITDQNPYLSEGTRQAAATTTALAKKYGADITVVVIDEKSKDSIPEHDARLTAIRWHLSEGGFKEFGLMERLGEGKKPTVIIGEVADELNLDLVVLSMEAIHSHHVDSNLLAEFIPCPVLLLPL